MKVLEIRGQTGTSRILMGERIGNLASHVPAGKAVFITDANVRRLYPAVFSGVPTIEIPAGEEAKTLETVAAIYAKLIELDLEPDVVARELRDLDQLVDELRKRAS